MSRESVAEIQIIDNHNTNANHNANDNTSNDNIRNHTNNNDNANTHNEITNYHLKTTIINIIEKQQQEI